MEGFNGPKDGLTDLEKVETGSKRERKNLREVAKDKLCSSSKILADRKALGRPKNVSENVSMYLDCFGWSPRRRYVLFRSHIGSLCSS